MDSTALTVFKEYLEKKVGVTTLLEPQPVKLHEPHLRLNPTGFSFRREGKADVGENVLRTVQFDLLVSLEAYGDGPDVFLNRVLAASFKLNLFFEDLKSIPFMPSGADVLENKGIAVSGNTVPGHMAIKGERKPGGQFFQNEKEKEGDKPFMFSESFNVSLFFPYAEINQ